MSCPAESVTTKSTTPDSTSPSTAFLSTRNTGLSLVMRSMFLSLEFMILMILGLEMIA
jgi:hypothetical protein